MGLAIMLVSLGVGAASIAAWVVVRFPHWAPDDLMRLIMHAVTVSLVHRIAVPTAFHAAAGDPSQKLVALFLVAFPAIVYALLVGFWMLRIMQRALSGLR